jgi:hypothetical protein
VDFHDAMLLGPAMCQRAVHLREASFADAVDDERAGARECEHVLVGSTLASVARSPPCQRYPGEREW